jgi:hypothetical protein
MKKLITSFAYFYTLTTLASAINFAYAQSASEPSPQNQVASIDTVPVNRSINDFFNKDPLIKKGIVTMPDGREVTFSVGTSTIDDKPTSPNYQVSRSIAYQKAMLEAKKQCAQQQSTKIQSEVITRYEQPEESRAEDQVNRLVKQGLDQQGASQLAASINSNKPLAQENLNTASAISEKVASNQIDQQIKSAGGNPDKPQTPEAMTAFTNSASFKKIAGSAAAARCTGLQVIASFESISSSGPAEIGLITAQSELMKSVAEAFGSGNWKYVPKGQPGKPISEHIPQDKSKLLSTLGTRIVRDEKGEWHVISFAQSSPKNPKSNNSKAIAKKEADFFAQEQINSFIGELVTVNNKFTQSQESRGLPEGEDIVAISTSSKEEIKTNAANTIVGLTSIYDEIVVHPVTQVPVYISVYDLSARGMKFGAAMSAPPKLQDQTAKEQKPSSNATTRSEDPKASKSYQQEGMVGRDF